MKTLGFRSKPKLKNPLARAQTLAKPQKSLSKFWPKTLIYGPDRVKTPITLSTSGNPFKKLPPAHVTLTRLGFLKPEFRHLKRNALARASLVRQNWLNKSYRDLCNRIDLGVLAVTDGPKAVVSAFLEKGEAMIARRTRAARARAGSSCWPTCSPPATPCL